MQGHGRIEIRLLILVQVQGAGVVADDVQIESVGGAEHPGRPERIAALDPTGRRADEWTDGGAIDAYARTLADQLTRQTGGTFLVENRAGAGGNISAEHVLKSPADGHTLWVTTHAMFTINPSVYPVMRWKQSDFKPIAKGVESPLLLAVHPSVPARTMPDLVNWLVANPNKAAYASFSPGTPSHFQIGRAHV